MYISDSLAGPSKQSTDSANIESEHRVCDICSTSVLSTQYSAHIIVCLTSSYKRNSNTLGLC